VIELRRVETEEDIDVFLGLRARIDPDHLPSRVAYLGHLQLPERIDLLATLDGEPVGCGFVEPHADNVHGTVAWISVRILRERRRRGVGTALFAELSGHARAGGLDAFIFAARHDDHDSLDYLAKRGFVEVLRMRESVLDLLGEPTEFPVPAGIELVRLETQHEHAMYEAAKLFARDIPTSEAVLDLGPIEQWKRDEVPPHTARECSFVALADGEVVGYTILIDDGNGVGLSSMTGVVPAWRRRGLALALKQASIAAARARGGFRVLRTANAIQNPMLTVNERLGYRRDVDWLHLRGPLLDRAEADRVPRSV
jgi:GNAT superfamily N-acetyltransferase